jgi:hypothetical protein
MSGEPVSESLYSEFSVKEISSEEKDTSESELDASSGIPK